MYMAFNIKMDPMQNRTVCKVFIKQNFGTVQWKRKYIENWLKPEQCL